MTFFPADGFTGGGSFFSVVFDGGNVPGGATARIVVSDDTVPVAADDCARLPLSGPATIPVLANDADPNGDPPTVTVAAKPGQGTAVVTPDGSIT